MFVMDRILLITTGWLLIVGGAIFLGILLEHVLHNRKIARLESNFDGMNFEPAAEGQKPSTKNRRLRRSA